MPGPKVPAFALLVGLLEVHGREVRLDANFRIELQYDGAGLHGWAKQPGLLTVEGCLEQALETALGVRSTLRIAGRTDAGVHARRQVFSVRLPREVDSAKLVGSLNALTPDGIAINTIRRVPLSFDARESATSRTYRYFLSTAKVMSPFWAPYCWHVGHELDISLMESAAASTVGQHDFTSFTPAVTEHAYFHRTVKRCFWRRVSGETGMLRLEIEADAFLRHMVRSLVGTMVEVGEGKRDLAGYRALLDGASREASGVTAPAHGLCLWSIKYDTVRGARPSQVSSTVVAEAGEEAVE